MRILLLLPLALLPLYLGAQTLANPCVGCGVTLEDFVYLWLDILQAVLIPIVVLALVYAGYLFVAAHGNEEQVTRGKKWLYSALIGAGIILGGRLLADVIIGTAALF